jgi:hypothetical protein
MKTIIIIFFSSVLLFSQAKDTLVSKQGLRTQIDSVIAEKDTLINYIQKLILQNVYEKNMSIQVDDKIYFLRDELIKRQQLEEMRELYFKKE